MKQPSLASTPARMKASRALLQVIDEYQSLSDVLLEYKQTATAKDVALIQELCFGVCRYYFYQQAILKKLITKPLRRKDRIVEMLLLTALYQLEHSTTPAHAIINETVAACVGLDRPFAKGLVNACLRRIAREPELKSHLEPAAEYAHPKWLYDQIQQAWPVNATEIFTANNQRPPFTLRINTQKILRSDFIKNCIDVGMTAIEHPVIATAVILEIPVPVAQIPGFLDGQVSVQDAASQIAALLLNPKSAMRILDACAAPGGKTVHLLQMCEGLELLALDVSETRLQRVEENCQRAKVHAKLLAADANDVATWWDGQLFDAILLDAPCSALGVIRRHPDIKLLRQATDIANLALTQKMLLQKLSACVKSGGRLLYSTCSILPEENHLQIESFLRENPEWKDITAEQNVGLAIWRNRVPVGMQILPGEAEMDGFYYALLERATK